MANSADGIPAQAVPPPTFTTPPSVSGFEVALDAFLASHPKFEGVITGALVFTRSPAAAPSSAGSQPRSEAGVDPSGSAPSAAGHDRILLIQRAAHDSLPSRWEIPGGECDAEDASLLHGVARELWEESGLVLKKIVRFVPAPPPQLREEGAQIFFSRRGQCYGKYNFEVEVDVEEGLSASVDLAEIATNASPVTLIRTAEAAPRVVLDPNEHQRYLWATEEECRARVVPIAAGGGTSRELVQLEFTTKDQEELILEAFRLRREANESAVEA